MESIDLSFQYDPARLPADFDINTSEGKNLIHQLIIDALESHCENKRLSSTDRALALAFTSEG